ncbi:MAG: hypothetical protein IT373_26830 [Polyangiaceae bacterium]|nr:hypothetical protein [Polyangiaceae bacterium]
MHRTFRAAVVALVAATALAGVSAPAYAGDPTAEDRAAARSAAERGSKLYNEKKFAEALDAFTRAEALLHAPTHVLMQARCHVALGQLVKAQEAYIKITRETLDPKAPAAFKGAQATAATELQALTPRIAEVTLVVVGPGADGAAVTLDGAPVPAALVGMARPLDPGKHVFAAKTAKGARAEVKVTLAEGETKTVELTLAGDAGAGPEAPGPGDGTPGPTAPGADDGSGGSGLRAGSYAMMALGGAAAVAGVALTVVSLKTRGEADDEFDACGVGCFGAPADSVRDLDAKATTLGNVSIGLYVGAAALLGAGIGMFVAAGSDTAAEPKTGSVEWMPWLGFGQGGVTGRF